MSELHVRQIKSVIERDVFPHIDFSSVQFAQGTEDYDKCCLSRALAGYIICSHSDIGFQQISKYITDGSDDNGIDAIYYERDSKRLHVVQSKWSDSGSGGWSTGDVEAVVRGLRDLFQALRDRFNTKVQEIWDEIMDALDDLSIHVVVYLASTMTTRLADHPQRIITDFVESVNDTTQILSVHFLGQSDLYRIISNDGAEAPIDLELLVYEWGRYRDPLDSYYGQVSALDLAEAYRKHGDRLFNKNIRQVIDRSEINESIAESAIQESEYFWYYNNGIVLIANKVEKTLRGGEERSVGTFVCENASIVNGAQSVSSLARACLESPDSVGGCRVMVRLITVDDSEGELATKITRATNTQNRIGRQDFVALDPEQERIRRELLPEAVHYVFKTGENLGDGVEGFGLTDATVALACADSDVSLSVQAKREIGLLWEDINTTPYKKLFNPSVNSIRLWRLVRVMRKVDEELRSRKDRDDNKRLVCTHGNRFVLHMIFCELDVDQFGKYDYDIEDDLSRIKVLVDALLADLYREVDVLYPESYAAPLFKNAKKCHKLKSHIMQSRQGGSHSSEPDLFTS